MFSASNPSLEWSDIRPVSRHPSGIINGDFKFAEENVFGGMNGEGIREESHY